MKQLLQAKTPGKKNPAEAGPMLDDPENQKRYPSETPASQLRPGADS